MVGSSEEPLLEVVYYDNCPGCIQDQKNECTRGIPYREFFFVWLIMFATVLPVACLFPFLYFMIRDLKIAKRVEDIGFYAGFVGASFMLGRALTSTVWGIIADHYGRKPVMIIGTITVIIFNTLFGLSVNYWMAIITRFLLGALNGLIGPIKAYAIEVCNKEHQALGISLASSAWAVGLVVGPAIGGYLSQPAEKFPNIFSTVPLFKWFPYFLPCLCISLIAVSALISCIWLPETLHTHGIDKEVESIEASTESNKKETMGPSSPKQQNLLKNWPLMSSILLFCIFSLDDMAFTEIFSLWAESDKRFGGLSFPSEDTGQVFVVSGFSLLLFQLFFYARLNRLLGPIILARICAALSIPLLFGFPFMTYLSGPILSVVVNCASLLKNILSVTIVNGTFILQNNAVPQDQRGAANGISITAMSLFKAVAPAASGAIFSWAQKRQQAAFLPGDQMVFFILSIVELIGLIWTFRPFLGLPKK
ncbi:hypothetical protein LUZ63_013161 [Rhynchospora breviuscula]|uniref:Major facilitator superfamily (MFS) profile domain-containing protein n=1 Tax=Rhynchospora breviuscula TaxID=2022672 RepID=A0A9Q0HJY4_9POAL|nr:hypothetical protein LUZ63_013161 [Rhynchospora breviuscula]